MVLAGSKQTEGAELCSCVSAGTRRSPMLCAEECSYRVHACTLNQRKNLTWLSIWVRVYSLPDTLLFSIAYYYTNWNKGKKERIRTSGWYIWFYYHSTFICSMSLAPIIIKTEASLWCRFFTGCAHNIISTKRFVFDIRKFRFICAPVGSGQWCWTF